LKLNCWELRNCGRGPGEGSSHPLGECPAAKGGQNEGPNKGTAMGRYCWRAMETSENGRTLPHWSRSDPSCITCEHFIRVRKEEDDEFKM